MKRYLLAARAGLPHRLSRPICRTPLTGRPTTRLRIGYSWDRFMRYITGAAAYGNVKMTPGGGAARSENKFGWTTGLGVEWALLGNWCGKLSRRSASETGAGLAPTFFDRDCRDIPAPRTGKNAAF
jgi:hypothetical protein